MANRKKKASNAKASATKQTKKKAGKKKARRTNWQRPEGWLTQQEAARLAGVSVQMFQRYGLDPIERRGRSTYYTAEQVLEHRDERAYRKGFESGLREGRDSVPEDAAGLMAAQARAELRLTEERGETQALKNAQLRRELIPVQVVSMVLAKIGAQISGALDPLAGQLKRRIPSMTTADTHVVKEQVAKCKNLAAAAGINDWDDIDPGGDAEID